MKKIIAMLLLVTMTLTMSLSVFASTEKNDFAPNTESITLLDLVIPDGFAVVNHDEMTEVQNDFAAGEIENIFKRGPAPALTSLVIYDLLVYNTTGELVVVTREIGTSSGRYVWFNGILSNKWNQFTEILWGSDNIAYGYYYYYGTGYYLTGSSSARIEAASDNAMAPWNRLTTSANVSW